MNHKILGFKFETSQTAHGSISRCQLTVSKSFGLRCRQIPAESPGHDLHSAAHLVVSGVGFGCSAASCHGHGFVGSGTCGAVLLKFSQVLQ